jgi:flagellar hook protein FlgE
MTAIPHAARALTSALGRFERASGRLLEAATGAGESDDIAEPLVDMMQAAHQARASIAVIKFSDAMMSELLDMQSDRPD